MARRSPRRTPSPPAQPKARPKKAAPSRSTLVNSDSSAPREVRVLSVQQPWADGILHGWKCVENRTWETPYRGRICIHASRRQPVPRLDDLTRYFKSRTMAQTVVNLWNLPGDREVGAILGSVDLVDIVPMDLVETIECLGQYDERLKFPKAAQRLQENFPGIALPRIQRVWDLVAHLDADSLWSLWRGPFCWILENPRWFAQPIPSPGKLNLWKFTLPAGADA